MNKFESKYYNTACLMDEAFILLLDKKEYEYITVKEVCFKAGRASTAQLSICIMRV